MPYCPECGTEIYRDNTYCKECGKELPEYENTPPQNPQPRQQRGQRQRRPETTDRNQVHFGQVIGIVSALAAGVGVFAPWLKVSAFGASTVAMGTEFIVGISSLAAAAGAFFLLFPRDKSLHALAAAGGVTIALLTLVFINDPLAMQGDMSEFEQEVTNAIADVGVGAYATLAGGIGITVGALASIFSD